MIRVSPRNGLCYQAFGTMVFSGSNDSEHWDELLNDSEISAWSNNEEKEWRVDNSTAYKYYKLVVTPYDKGNCVSVSNINLMYGSVIKEY